MLTGKELGLAIREAIKMKGVTQRELARVFDVKPPSIQDWMNKGTVSKEKLPALWKYFDDVVGPEHWGLDQFPRWPSRPRTTPPRMAESQPEYAGTMLKMQRVPVVGTAKLGDNGYYDEISSVVGAGDGHIEIAVDDPNAYGIRVKGQSMFPAIRDGWYVLVKPNGTPQEGEYVLLKLADGRKMVKELLFRRKDSIEVMSVNGGERMTFDLADLEGVHAVGAVVSPSQWRPD